MPLPSSGPQPVRLGVGISGPPSAGTPPRGRVVKAHSPLGVEPIKPDVQARTMRMARAPGGWPGTVTVCEGGLTAKNEALALVPITLVANGVELPGKKRPSVAPPARRPSPPPEA